MKHKAWLVLVAMCGLVAASVGISINTSGVFYSVVANSLHIYRGSFAFHMTIFSLVTAITALLLASSSSILLVGSFLFGSCYGLGAVSSPLLTRMAFGDQNYGKTFPIVSFAGNIGASLAFSSIGYIYDFSSSYRPAFLIIVLMLVVSAVNVVLLDRKGSSR